MSNFNGCPYQVEDGFNDRNRFPHDHLFIGEIEDGKRYPLGVYTKEEVDEKTTALEESIETKADETEAVTIRQRLDALEHTDFMIRSFTANPELCEMGSANLIELTWELSREATEQNINGTPVEGTSKFYNNVTRDTEYTLNVSDGEATASKTVAVTFANQIYYGAAEGTGDISRLTAELSNNPEREFKANAGAGKYIIYASPVRLGNIRLFVGGIEGGFGAPEEIRIQNGHGYWEPYLVYKSVNANLGETIIEARRDI